MAIPGNLLSATTETVDPNTSGWVSKLNCSISLGTGGRSGDGTLKLTSTASGEMQARTSSSYTVTPLKEYQVFADASGATVPERIGIRWLTSASSEISITWSLTTASASATWHRISVAGVAPSNAAKAQVVVSATPAAGGVINHFENVYLGLPMRTTGNLLTAAAEGFENATYNWAVESNCTIARAVPMVQWPVDWYWGGGHMLAMTVTAGGNASVKVTEKPTATAGTEYVGYAYLSPPTSGSTTWVELRFYDASDVQLSATRANLSAPGTGVYRQVVSAVAPATTAYAVLAAGITSGTAAQIVRIDGAVIATAPVLREGSVVPYADASFEKDVAGWTVISGVATLARLTPWGTDSLDGSYAMTVTSATATTSVIRSAKFAIGAAAAGLTFTTEYGMKVAAGGWTLTRSIRWYSATNVDLGVSSGSAAAVPSPNWWLLSIQQVAPAGATQAAIEWTLAATSVSSVLRVDKTSLWQSLPLVETSTHDEDAYITLTLRELPVGDTVTVWRVGADGNRTLVRGASGLIDGETTLSDVLVVEDYEAPLDAPVSYYAETKNSSGALTATRSSATATLGVDDENYCWIKDPGEPQRNMRVQAVTAPDWARPIQQTEHHVRGRRNSVTLSDVRGGLQGELVVRTQSDEERTKLHRLLDPGHVYLLQFAPLLGLEDKYFTVGQAVEGRVTAYGGEPRRLWTLPLKEEDMPITVGVAGSAGRTWQDILTENSTWADLMAKYATWEDVLFDRRL